MKGLVTRRGLFALASIVGSTGAALILAEAALQNGLIQAPLLEPDIYRIDGNGNLSLRPHQQLRHSTAQWSVSIETNSLGHREPEPTPDDHRQVVLGIGDSFAFGWGVEQSESLISRLQAGQARDVRWVNAAVPGSGPGDHWRRLPALLAETEPLAVVLALFVGNDFADVRFGGTSRYEILDGMLTLRDDRSSALAGFKRELVRRSRLLQAMRAWQFSRGVGSAQPDWDYWRREFADIHRATPSADTLAAIRSTLNLLENISNACRRRGSEFVLIVIPSSFQVRPGGIRELREGLGVAERDLDMDRPQRLLAEWAAQTGCTMVDLLPAFRMHYARHPNDSLYHFPDAHWNARGHALAAEVALDTLDEALDLTLTSRRRGEDFRR